MQTSRSRLLLIAMAQRYGAQQLMSFHGPISLTLSLDAGCILHRSNCHTDTSDRGRLLR